MVSSFASLVSLPNSKSRTLPSLLLRSENERWQRGKFAIYVAHLLHAFLLQFGGAEHARSCSRSCICIWHCVFSEEKAAHG